MAKGEKIMTSVSVNNGKMEVPSILLAPTAVNIGNLADTVIADGFHSKEEVYQETEN